MTSTLVPALASGGLVGFSLGLVGGGGSILATPLLLYVVGVASPHIAIGTSALAVSINAYANLLAHARKGHVRWLCAAVFAAAGTLGALLGSSLGLVVDGTRLLLLFGVRAHPDRRDLCNLQEFSGDDRLRLSAEAGF